MSKFREEPISNPEKNFVFACLEENERIDDRLYDEFRELKIQFGSEWGSCHVALGETQVLAQVSCEVQTPNSTRPSEGLLYVNLELGPLAAPHYEIGRPSDLSVQLNRMLEKCIKDSKAVDLESLCIKVNEKVWALRVDCSVLNDAGNVVDCASAAALGALAHFRRPDVTCDGEEVVVHTYAQRDSIPTVLHHWPVCVSYAVFKHGEAILADPSTLEELVSDAQLTIGLNSYKEVCGFHLAGSAMMAPEQILATTQRAAERAVFVIGELKRAIEHDAEARSNEQATGFKQSYLLEESDEEEVTGEMLEDLLDGWTKVEGRKRAQPSDAEVVDLSETVESKRPNIEKFSEKSAELVPQDQGNGWELYSDEEEEEEETASSKKPECKQKNAVRMDTDGSEEETTIVLNADKLTKKNKPRRK